MIHNVFVSFSYLFMTNYLFMKKVQNYAGHSVTVVAVLMIGFECLFVYMYAFYVIHKHIDLPFFMNN